MFICSNIFFFFFEYLNLIRTKLILYLSLCDVTVKICLKHFIYYLITLFMIGLYTKIIVIRFML